MSAKNYQPYNPAETEEKIYDLWEKSGYFNPDVCVEKGITKPDAEPFSIVLPPPNVTGTLHTGHALMLAVEDALVRFNRMRGKKTLWLPGTDHAAIATQSKVEKMLKKEGVSRYDLGREKFLARIKEYAQESHDNIVKQLKKMGSSLDWSREAFTLDEKREVAVRTAFKKMYDAGLIFRGSRIVNWDPKGQTTISDDEIVYEEEKTTFYYFKYGPFTIGTTRPETKFGDKYVVMHPEDERYQEYEHGQKIDLEWINGPITAIVIKDTAIDMSFGTGVMTITPWHSQIDFEIAQRHDLDKEQIIDQKGKLLPIAGEFAGMPIAEARSKIVAKLKDKGLWVKEEEYVHNVAKADRTQGVIEPQLLEQWFIDVSRKFKIRNSKFASIKDGEELTLKELMQRVVRSGEVQILPARFEQNYFHWIDNLRDWCISRQLWYGHRVPVWYRNDLRHPERNEGKSKDLNISCSDLTEEDPSTLVGMTKDDGREIYVGVTPPEGEGWVQDQDTLDTWFSSGLWTFSTLGYPEETSDLQTYHPTSVLETGYDILFFWVARMILMSGFLLEEVPFRTVYLHGMVRDEKGRKMSKSLDNATDPLQLIDQFGADALRLAMLFGVGVGSDQSLGAEKVKGMRNFVNKVNNISRFIQMNCEGHLVSKDVPTELTTGDQEIIKKSGEVASQVTTLLESFRLSDALQETYDFVWNSFASTYLESVKDRLREGETATAEAARWTLLTVFQTQLKLLHPFMPFVTESLYQEWKGLAPEWFSKEALMVEVWD